MPIPFSDKAMAKIKEYLSDVRQSVSSCRNATEPETFAKAWDGFLRNAGRVVNAIEGECSTTPQGRQWYGGQRRRARDDAFLSYMFQARHIAEHQPSDDPIQHDGPVVTLKNVIFDASRVPKGGSLVTFRNNTATVDRRFITSIGNGGGIYIVDGKCSLQEHLVDSRFNNIFVLPPSFEGRSIDKNNPSRAAEMYLNYLENLANSIAID